MDRPTEGFFTLGVAGDYPSQQLQSVLGEARQIVEAALAGGGGALDREALCIRAGRAAWSIRVDVHVVDDGGNVLDAVHLATVCTPHLSSLSSYLHPVTEINFKNSIRWVRCVTLDGQT